MPHRNERMISFSFELLITSFMSFFSTFRILPNTGRIACVTRSRASFAVPAAESNWSHTLALCMQFSDELLKLSLKDRTISSLSYALSAFHFHLIRFYMMITHNLNRISFGCTLLPATSLLCHLDSV